MNFEKNVVKIALFGLAIALFGVAISTAGLFYTIGQLNSTNSLLEEGQITSKNIENLVNESSKQLELLSAVLTESKHQTLMAELETLKDQYEKGSTFSVSVDSCSFMDDEIIFSLGVFDNKSIPSIVKFEIIIDFITYTVGGEPGNEYHEIINPQQIIFEPGVHKEVELSLEKILDFMKDAEDSALYLKTQYRFAPYFDKQGIVISEYILDSTGDLLLGFKKDMGSGKWNPVTDNPNIVCKQKIEAQ